MAIVGIGTDIVEISRIEAVIGRSGDRFAKRILSDAEWDAYRQHKQPVRFLAKRFAVKEAASKALGTRFVAKICSFLDEVILKL